MIRSKRLLAVGLVAVLGITAAACGGDDDDDGDAEGTTPPAGETIGTSGGDDTAPTTGGDDTAATTGGDTTPTTGGGDTTPTTGGGDTTPTTGGDGTTPEGTTAPAVESPAVGLLFDITGRGDRSFNDAAAAGLDQAVEEFGATGSESDRKSVV